MMEKLRMRSEFINVFVLCTLYFVLCPLFFEFVVAEYSKIEYILEKDTRTEMIGGVPFTAIDFIPNPDGVRIASLSEGYAAGNLFDGADELGPVGLDEWSFEQHQQIHRVANGFVHPGLFGRIVNRDRFLSPV